MNHQGFASRSPDVPQFSVVSEVTSINPSSGSRAGCAEVTILGTGTNFHRDRLYLADSFHDNVRLFQARSNEN